MKEECTCVLSVPNDVQVTERHPGIIEVTWKDLIYSDGVSEFATIKLFIPKEHAKSIATKLLEHLAK
jgi:hypothetical protein